MTGDRLIVTFVLTAAEIVERIEYLLVRIGVPTRRTEWKVKVAGTSAQAGTTHIAPESISSSQCGRLFCEIYNARCCTAVGSRSGSGGMKGTERSDYEGAAMAEIDFRSMPVGEHDGTHIALCPKCGRHGRVLPRLGGGRVYDHVARPLEPNAAGTQLEILEWCEVRGRTRSEDGQSPGRGFRPLLPR